MPALPYDHPDRVAWRETNADLISWLEETTHAVVGDNFLHSVMSDLRTYGSLTAAQTDVVRQRYNEIVELRERVRQEAGETTVGYSPAGPHDLTHISNGIYVVSDGFNEYTYRIHTVLQGTLRGQRIIKRQSEYGGMWSGFATLLLDGSMHLWRRFSTHTDEPYVRYARALVQELSDELSAASVHIHIWNGGLMFRSSLDQHRINYHVSGTKTCRVCNQSFSPLVPELDGRGLHRGCDPNPPQPTPSVEAYQQAGVDELLRPARRSERAPRRRPSGTRMSEIDPEVIQ